MTDEGKSLALIAEADKALARAEHIVDVLTVREGLVGIEALLHAINAGYEVQQRATIMRLKAERKAGSWLAEHIRQGRSSTDNGVVHLGDVGITRWQSHRWQMYATLGDARFLAWVDDHLAKGWEVSASGLYRYATNADGKGKGIPSSQLLLAPTKQQCALRGYLIPCDGPLTGQHVISKQMARGNAAVRDILRACPPELMAQVCYQHNVGKMADSHNARRILLLQKVYEYGLEHMNGCIRNLPWKVHLPELSLMAMLEPKEVKT
jgi:hypothetical protein